MGVVYYVCKTMGILLLYLISYRLLTQGYELRWDEVWAKRLLANIYTIWILALILTAWFCCKYTSLEYVLSCIFMTSLAVIFYKVSLLDAFLSSMALWVNLRYFMYLFEALGAYEARQADLEAFSRDFSAFYISDVAGMAVAVCIMLLLLRIRRGGRMIEYQSVREKVVLFAVLFAETFLQNYLIQRRSALTLSLFTGLVICGLIIFFLYHAYKEKQMEIQMINTRNTMAEEQFNTLEALYQEKRIQIHDTVQKNILLQGYLKAGKYKEAESFLEEMQEGCTHTDIRAETGILEIDLVLYHKRRMMQEKGVRFEVELDVIACPLQRKDICILLGNLLDNAAEAVQELPEGSREVELKIKSVNRMFMIKVSNRYVLERNVGNGKYYTTKQEKNVHGLGLESCKEIVESYGGEMEIVDLAGEFTVGVLI